MTIALNRIQLQIVLEVSRLSTLENLSIRVDGSSNIYVIEEGAIPLDEPIIIPDVVFLEVFRSIEESILKTLKSDTSDSAGTMFLEYALQRMVTDKFKEVVHSIYNKYMSGINKGKNDKLINKTPKLIQTIMQQLTAAGNDLRHINHFPSNNVYDQYFLSQFMISKLDADSFVFDSKKINKRKLYDMVYGTDANDFDIYDKIEKIQKKYTSVFEKVNEDVSYDTAKKRLQQVLPSKHKDGTMNQSDELNVFKQNALLVIFLIYKTKYQRFLSNPTTQRVPDSITIEETKKAIEEFFKEYPISGVGDELFLKTVLEDTYHFVLFNALTRLTTSVLSAVNRISTFSIGYDSLQNLFIIDQMIESTPNLVNEWMKKLLESNTGFQNANESPEIQQSIFDAIEDEEALEYAKNTMLDMFEKYNTLHHEETDYDFTEVIFKKIVKDYYASNGGGNAYAK